MGSVILMERDGIERTKKINSKIIFITQFLNEQEH